MSEDPAFTAFVDAYEAGRPALLNLTLVADLETPVAAFLKLRAEHPGTAFLLESVEGGVVRGRYSMIGLDPDLAWRCRDGLATDVVARIFATPVGKSSSAASGETRAVFKVTAATVPPFVTTTQEAQRLEDQLRAAMSDDLLIQYIAQAQSEIGVTVNQEAVRRAVGGET